MKLHGFHDNPLCDFKDWGCTYKMLKYQQQLILKHLTWYQFNLTT